MLRNSLRTLLPWWMGFLSNMATVLKLTQVDWYLYTKAIKLVMLKELGKLTP